MLHRRDYAWALSPPMRIAATLAAHSRNAVNWQCGLAGPDSASPSLTATVASSELMSGGIA
jgi:hypothetical protein